MLVLLALGCDPSAPADDPPAATAATTCLDLPHEELRVPCLIAQAEDAAQAHDPEIAAETCHRVPAGRWGDECWFRAGEELARSGDVVGGARFCGLAGAFARFCMTHVSWRLKPDPVWEPSSAATATLPETYIQRGQQALARLSPADRAASLRDLRAGLWHRTCYGSGTTDPTAARAATGDDTLAAHTAWALEAVRLLAPWDQPVPADLDARVAAAWSGSTPPVTGEPLPRERRVGRYSPGVPPRELGEVRAWPTFGGGVRLVAQDAAVDLRVAMVEALFFRETTTAEDLLPYVDDPAPEVRRTAAWRVVGLLRPEPGQVLPFSEHADPVVRALASPPQERP